METSFASPQYYRHVDGGLYRKYTEALHTEDLGKHVVYEHVWPYPVTPSVRPAKAFALRFTAISDEEAHRIMAGDRAAGQEAIRAAKRERQAREGKVSKPSSLQLYTGQEAQDALYRLAATIEAGGFITYYVSRGDDNAQLAGTADEIARQSPEELERYDLITLDATLMGLDRPWRYTFDPANMTGALAYTVFSV